MSEKVITVSLNNVQVTKAQLQEKLQEVEAAEQAARDPRVRRDSIEAGKCFSNTPVGVVLLALRVTPDAQRVGVPTNVFFHCWPDGELFWRDGDDLVYPRCKEGFKL